MAERSTYDIVKSAIPVHVGVLSSDDAQVICHKNNLSFSELVEPFCTLTNEAQIQGSGSPVYRIYNMHIHVSDIRDESLNVERPAAQQLVADLIAESATADNSQITIFPCGNHSLSVNRTCPWMDTYRDLVFRFGPPQEHEFLHHLVACMLVVSSSNTNPLQEFANISQQQNLIQHGGRNEGTSLWMTPNTLKYYVLLHDVQNGDILKAKEVFSSLQAMYGHNMTCLLQINSGSPSTSESGHLPMPWHHFRNYSVGQKREKSTCAQTNQPSNQVDGAFKKKFGCCLTMLDHNALNGFMQQFISYALLPYLEKIIKNVTEQLSARKALHKSLFRATRTLFGSAKSAPSFGSTTGYHHDSNELLLRKAADLCFLTQMYDQAFNFYHSAKKDYTNDHAWLYAAGASEMAALSNFMQQNSQKNYPAHYMESAISSYLDVCKNDHLALRCTLLHVECLQHMGLFQDAAFHLIKMTNETDDLKSALLLEQAAHCYLKMQKPHPKKFAFQLILAGHRFTKCRQRTHALRCYDIALQVYAGKDWQLAEDHLNLAVARQSYNTKQIQRAAEFFRKLLMKESDQPGVQQTLILREFISVFQQDSDFKESGFYASLKVPLIKVEETEVSMGHEDLPEGIGAEMATLVNMKIFFLEKYILEAESLLRNQVVGATTFLCRSTANVECPRTAVGEKIVLLLLCDNYLNTPICLLDVELKWDFQPWENELLVHEDNFIQCYPLAQLSLPPCGKCKARFIITAHKAGKLLVTGITYRLGQLSNNGKVDAGASIMDYQRLHVAGKRLNHTKNEKTGCVYDIDCRLNVHVYAVLPRISVRFESLPSSMLCNELVSTKLEVQNVGSVPIDVLKVAASDPVLITIINSSGLECSLPNLATSDMQGLVEAAPMASLLQKPLLPGEIAEFCAKLKAPASPGSYKADMLFFCKSEKLAAPSCRTYFIDHIVTCTEGIEAKVDIVTPLSQSSFILAVSLRNIAVTSAGRLVLEEVRCRDHGCSIKAMNYQESFLLPQSTSVLRYYLVRKTKERAKSEDPSRSLLPATNVAGAGDLLEIAIRWCCERGESRLLGEHQLNAKYLFGNFGTISPVFMQTGNNDEISLQTMHHLVSWRLSYKPSRIYDFASGCFCYVNLSLIVFNLSDKELFVHASIPQVGICSGIQSQSGFSWIGATEKKLVIDAHGEIDVPLKACFSRPGIFNLCGVGVTALPIHLIGVEVPIPQKPLCGYYIEINDYY